MPILDIEHESPESDLSIGADRRAHHRLSISAPASIRLGSGPWRDAAITRNLSAGGALIEAPSALVREYAAGDPIGFEVRLPAYEGVWPTPTTGAAEAIVLRTFPITAMSDDSAAERSDVAMIALRFCERMRFRFD
ncbi:MAG TPA: PilZ domain-containing protein [Phycisphaerae bacterium]|nr:PilZ domain-containing protein [Phycisphaerae bacterium]HRW52956.1 PilZ domain-containing protein [Phycisphaerae bacterium]